MGLRVDNRDEIDNSVEGVSFFLSIVQGLCCSVLQRVAACCNVLQCTWNECHLSSRLREMCCTVLQCVAARCNMLQ